jgi:hypothetical protein
VSSSWKAVARLQAQQDLAFGFRDAAQTCLRQINANFEYSNQVKYRRWQRPEAVAQFFLY